MTSDEIEKVRELSELFWQFHNDRLKDPNLTEMGPYIEPILKLLAERDIQVKADKVYINQLMQENTDMRNALTTLASFVKEGES